jgi:phage gp46-like protein
MDIALKFSDSGDFDIVVQDGDLLGDPGPVTPVTVSLFVDRVARVDDPLPETQPGIFSDRRGWWGDLVRAEGRADPIGSRLWLLTREKELPVTVARAQEYTAEALAWIVALGGETQVVAEDAGKGRLSVDVRIKTDTANASVERWSAILDVTKPSRIALLGV